MAMIELHLNTNAAGYGTLAIHDPYGKVLYSAVRVTTVTMDTAPLSMITNSFLKGSTYLEVRYNIELLSTEDLAVTKTIYPRQVDELDYY